MIRIGIIGENYQNDACAFKAFLTPQYQGKIEFVPILKSLNGGTPPIAKVLRMLPIEIEKHKLNTLLCILDLDEESKLNERNKWFADISNKLSIKNIFYLAVMELEALILADIDTFNKIYDIDGQYFKNPKFEINPKSELRRRTIKARRQYIENDAIEVFKALSFDIVYKNHIGDNSFKNFIDVFEKTLDVKRIENKG